MKLYYIYYDDLNCAMYQCIIALVAINENQLLVFLCPLMVYFWFKHELGQKNPIPQVRPERVRTHDILIMTVQFMSLRRLL